MIPLPDHLADILDVDTALSDEHHITGSLCCTCGCQVFTLESYSCPGDEGRLRVQGCDGSHALMVNARCTDCGSEYTVFDAARHCYDGMVCGEYVTPPRDELKAYTCGCGGRSFRLSLFLEMEDREQFIEEVVNELPGVFTAEAYVNALNWITINLLCDHCGEEIPEWVDLEGC